MIASFKDFIHEERKHTLTVFDIDETLFKTEALVDVVKDNAVVRQLYNQEFNLYKLQEGESFDFHQFMSAENFKETKKHFVRQKLKGRNFNFLWSWIKET